MGGTVAASEAAEQLRTTGAAHSSFVSFPQCNVRGPVIPDVRVRTGTAPVEPHRLVTVTAEGRRHTCSAAVLFPSSRR